ncbi:glycosyltransferase [Candidatus Woesearchaeota archaeon]|nr:glycosyltransferase [Candidatus Woesearchaeota archaeon]
MLSIIIPTWNEQKYLPRLLRCIRRQTFRDFEIIVADSRSTDRTRKIARNFGCRVVLVRKKTIHGPAPGRNLGANAAQGDILIFFDADVEIRRDFLAKAAEELNNKKADVAGTLISPDTNNFLDRLFIGVFNSVITTTQFFYPNAYGGSIICRKWLHKKVHGFDEGIFLGEDLDYVQRCGKKGRFRILRNARAIFSMRRFAIEGRWRVGSRYVLSGLYHVFFGQIRSDIFRYKMKYKK